MATSKRSASPSRTGRPIVTAIAQRGKPLPPPVQPPRTSSAATPPSAPIAGTLCLSTLLMVGTDRVIIDAAEDDDLHFMADYIDPA